MDALAQVLSMSRVQPTSVDDFAARGRWAVELAPEGITAFHLVRTGSCWLSVDEQDPVPIAAGDVALVVSGRRHVIGSDPGVLSRPYAEVLGDHGEARTATGGRIRIPGDGPVTRLLCGGYRVEPDFQHPVLDRLPTVLHLQSTGSASSLGVLADLLADEIAAQRAGATTMADRLVDAMLIQVLRCWAEVDPGRARWIAALADPVVADALSVMHTDPARSWTVETLAEQVGQSRSTFASRFNREVGEPPMTYLTRWRMELAARQLRELSDDVASIARSVGYESVYAFSRAFRRVRGQAPTHYRAEVATAR